MLNIKSALIEAISELKEEGWATITASKTSEHPAHGHSSEHFCSHIFRVSLLHFAFFLFIDDQVVRFVGCLWRLCILWTFHGACSLSIVFIAVSALRSWWWWCCCLSKDAIPRTWYQLRFVRIQLPLCHDPRLFTLSTPLQTVPSNFRTTKKNCQARRTLYLHKCKNGGLNYSSMW